jgi:hypothetical protein
VRAKGESQGGKVGRRRRKKKKKGKYQKARGLIGHQQAGEISGKPGKQAAPRLFDSAGLKEKRSKQKRNKRPKDSRVSGSVIWPDSSPIGTQPGRGNCLLAAVLKVGGPSDLAIARPIARGKLYYHHHSQPSEKASKKQE